MNQRTRLIVVIAAIALAAATLAVALAQCGARPVPAAETPGATTAAVVTTPTNIATEESGMPTATPGPTSTPTEGEKAAAAVGQEYSNYKPTQAECDQAFESGEVEACVWPDSIQLIVRPEWEQLFPSTNFYVIGLTGRYQEPEYDHYRRTRLVAWQDGQRYTAETFDRLLKANGITEITDGNRELIAKAFALMTIPDYLGDEVLFTEWGETDWPASFGWRYNWNLIGWTKIQGLRIRWLFMFEDGHLRITDGGVPEYNTGDYIDVRFDVLPLPSRDDFNFYFWEE